MRVRVCACAVVVLLCGVVLCCVLRVACCVLRVVCRNNRLASKVRHAQHSVAWMELVAAKAARTLCCS